MDLRSVIETHRRFKNEKKKNLNVAIFVYVFTKTKILNLPYMQAYKVRTINCAHSKHCYCCSVHHLTSS